MQIFSRSLEHFFLTAGQNNFDNKILLVTWTSLTRIIDDYVMQDKSLLGSLCIWNQNTDAMRTMQLLWTPGSKRPFYYLFICDLTSFSWDFMPILNWNLLKMVSLYSIYYIVKNNKNTSFRDWCKPNDWIPICKKRRRNLKKKIFCWQKFETCHRFWLYVRMPPTKNACLSIVNQPSTIWLKVVHGIKVTIKHKKMHF